MNNHFKSSISLIIFIPLAVLLVAEEIIMLYKGIFSGAIIIVLVMIFIVYLCVNTTYTFIDDSKLKIKAGFLINIEMEVLAINSVKQTNNPLAAPALSLDRLEITYNNNNKILISPKRKSAFIEKLKMINPGILFG